MRPADDGSDAARATPLEGARAALQQAREAVQKAEDAVREAEAQGGQGPTPVTVEPPPWTWRERLWSAPAETRVGVSELVEALDVSESWVYQRTKKDADDPLPHRKFAGSLRFVVGEVRAWCREREEAPVSGPMWSAPDGPGLDVVEGGAR